MMSIPRKAEPKSKVFGIGFHKTGTSSLAEALKILGYNVTGPNFVRESEKLQDLLPNALQTSKKFDAFQDNPWPILYREMDALYPDARFILTTRNENEWIRSIERHFKSESTPMRELIYGLGYGSPLGNEEHYKKTMLRHNQEVVKYFAQRPQKLLVIDITAGGGWDELCGFLACDVPRIRFPKVNTAHARRISNLLRFWPAFRK